MSGPDGPVWTGRWCWRCSPPRTRWPTPGIVVGRDVDPDRIGVIVGGVGGMATLEKQVLARGERGRAAVSPYLLTGILPNMPAARIAITHGIRGYSSSVGTACASGAQAIADGAAADPRPARRTWWSAGPARRRCSRRSPTRSATRGRWPGGWDDPTAASRPFDLRRNGFVLAEGAAMLVLERAEHADARGAAGYADVAGWGATTDAHHPTAPRPDGAGAAACMRRALAERAASTPAAVGYVNAHGTQHQARRRRRDRRARPRCSAPTARRSAPPRR